VIKSNIQKAFVVWILANFIAISFEIGLQASFQPISNRNAYNCGLKKFHTRRRSNELC